MRRGERDIRPIRGSRSSLDAGAGVDQARRLIRNGVDLGLRLSDIPPMTSFRVDPIELLRNADSIDRSEPFSRLAEAAARLSTPPESGATSAALVRLRLRLVGQMYALSDEAASLASSTRDAADHYRAVESSIMEHTQA